MVAPRLGNNGVLDLSETSALIVEPDPYAAKIVSQFLRGFNLGGQKVAESGEEAKKIIGQMTFGLVIVEAVLPDMPGGDLVKWLRRHADPAIRHLPVIILTGHTVLDNIQAARNSGANMVLKKPVTSPVLFDRIVWSAKADRLFIETATYVGPDRRFKSLGPPDGVGRRSTDLSAEVGDAKEPNLAQFEIDSFIKPVKVSLD